MLSVFTHMKPVRDANSEPGLPVLFNTYYPSTRGYFFAMVLLTTVATTRRVLQNMEYQMFLPCHVCYWVNTIVCDVNIIWEVKSYQGESCKREIIYAITVPFPYSVRYQEGVLQDTQCMTRLF